MLHLITFQVFLVILTCTVGIFNYELPTKKIYFPGALFICDLTPHFLFSLNNLDYIQPVGLSANIRRSLLNTVSCIYSFGKTNGQPKDQVLLFGMQGKVLA